MHDPAAAHASPPFYPDTALVRQDYAAYYDEISRFDADLGTVLEEPAPPRAGREHAGGGVRRQRGAQFRGKGTLYEFGIRCPLIVRGPGVRAGAVVSDLVSGEDLAPMFLVAASVAVPREMTGRNALPALRGERYESRAYVFAQRGAHGPGSPTSTAAFDLGRVVVGPRHKLIYNASWQLPYWPVDFAGDAMWKELEQRNLRRSVAGVWCGGCTSARRGRCSRCTTCRPTRTS